MSATPQEADRGTVVIADDAAEVVEPVRLILELTGYRVVALAEGVGAGALIRSVRPALTILDLRLPDTDGWDILEALRRDPATAALPVLICTALPEELEARGPQLRELGCEALLKPFSITELLERVGRLADRPRAEG